MNKNIAMRMAFALALFLALILVGALVRYFLIGKPSTFLTVKVDRGNIENSVMTTGSLQAHQQVDVGAQISGQLKTLKVRLGDHVEKGQLLAIIDPLISQNALSAAKASLESLVAQHRAVSAGLAQADLAYRRQQKMLEQEATSLQEVEIAKAQLLVQRATLASFEGQIKQAKTQVDTAQVNLEFTKITAPMSGEVVAIITREGQTVVASQQAPVILKLANLDVMTVKALISEADVINIRKGQTTYFTILGANSERHFGKVGTIEPAPQDFADAGPKVAGPVYYNALFNTPNTDLQLRIGMTAQVTVVLREAQNVLLIPISALGKATEIGHYPVRVLGKRGRVTTEMVSVGLSDTVSVEIREGLKEGDEVIIQEVAS